MGLIQDEKIRNDRDVGVPRAYQGRNVPPTTTSRVIQRRANTHAYIPRESVLIAYMSSKYERLSPIVNDTTSSFAFLHAPFRTMTQQFSDISLVGKQKPRPKE